MFLSRQVLATLAVPKTLFLKYRMGFIMDSSTFMYAAACMTMSMFFKAEAKAFAFKMLPLCMGMLKLLSLFKAFDVDL